MRITSPAEGPGREPTVTRELLTYYRDTRDKAALDLVPVREPANPEALDLASNLFLKTGGIPEGIDCLQR